MGVCLLLGLGELLLGGLWVIYVAHFVHAVKRTAGYI